MTCSALIAGCELHMGGPHIGIAIRRLAFSERMRSQKPTGKDAIQDSLLPTKKDCHDWIYATLAQKVPVRFVRRCWVCRLQSPLSGQPETHGDLGLKFFRRAVAKKGLEPPLFDRIGGCGC